MTVAASVNVRVNFILELIRGEDWRISKDQKSWSAIPFFFLFLSKEDGEEYSFTLNYYMCCAVGLVGKCEGCVGNAR